MTGPWSLTTVTLLSPPKIEGCRLGWIFCRTTNVVFSLCRLLGTHTLPKLSETGTLLCQPSHCLEAPSLHIPGSHPTPLCSGLGIAYDSPFQNFHNFLVVSRLHSLFLIKNILPTGEGRNSPSFKSFSPWGSVGPAGLPCAPGRATYTWGAQVAPVLSLLYFLFCFHIKKSRSLNPRVQQFCLIPVVQWLQNYLASLFSEMSLSSPHPATLFLGMHVPPLLEFCISCSSQFYYISHDILVCFTFFLFLK